MRESSPRQSARSPRDELLALVQYLDEIAAALAERDRMAVERLIRRRSSSHLPREIRDELLSVARQGATGFRAAIDFLRYRHRMRELARGGEELPRPQLELGLGRDVG